MSNVFVLTSKKNEFYTQLNSRDIEFNITKKNTINGIVNNYQLMEFQNKRLTKFTLYHPDLVYSINCEFWEFEKKLNNNDTIDLHCAILKKDDIVKLTLDQYNRTYLTIEAEQYKYPIQGTIKNLSINLTTKTIFNLKEIRFANQKTLFALTCVVCDYSKDEKSIKLRLMDASDDIRSANLWLNSEFAIYDLNKQKIDELDIGSNIVASIIVKEKRQRSGDIKTFYEIASFNVNE